LSKIYDNVAKVINNVKVPKEIQQSLLLYKLQELCRVF